MVGVADWGGDGRVPGVTRQGTRVSAECSGSTGACPAVSLLGIYVLEYNLCSYRFGSIDKIIERTNTCPCSRFSFSSPSVPNLLHPAVSFPGEKPKGRRTFAFQLRQMKMVLGDELLLFLLASASTREETRSPSSFPPARVLFLAVSASALPRSFCFFTRASPISIAVSPCSVQRHASTLSSTASM
ncbi:hypothetical protein Taro_029241 [Colocasia esculenta]|uniref:Uncharacterized protein n=1 Tax=Colocasia esculenta TaxID=4460 RepID=A0A843VDC3_COLES|nr:hypothetical protein [Colocasia esculenta]